MAVATGLKGAPQAVAPGVAADAEQGSRGETLSSLAATSGDRSRAFALVLVSAIAFAALAPFAQQPLAAVHAFIPGYQAALVMGDLITASLLREISPLLS